MKNHCDHRLKLIFRNFNHLMMVDYWVLGFEKLINGKLLIGIREGENHIITLNVNQSLIDYTIYFII